MNWHTSLPWKWRRFLVADAAKLRQVLINLVGNAVKFTKRGEARSRLQRAPRNPPGCLPHCLRDGRHSCRRTCAGIWQTH